MAEEPVVPKSGQIWRRDGLHCLLLGKIARDWLSVVLNGRGHDGSGAFSISPHAYGWTPSDFIPRCFYWVWTDGSVFMADNIVEYVKKIVRSKADWTKTINYNTIWE